MSILAALRFLTIIPLPRRETSPEEMGQSLVFFPVVGLIIGLTLAALDRLFSLGLPSAVTNVLLVAWLTILTGAMHLDGFADTCDGIGGQKTAEARLVVMRDSRIGSFGAVGISLLLLVKFAAMSSLPQPLRLMTLMVMPVISRWAMVYAVFAYPYARASGMGTAFKQAAGRTRFIIATLMAVVIILVVAWLSFSRFSAGLILMGAAWVIIILMAAYLKNKFSGLTGDSYGAVNEVAEVVVLIMASLLANHWLPL